ncbi:MAG: hypothetical protein ACRETB_03380 [Steroidobacteraceae bacterium]
MAIQLTPRMRLADHRDAHVSVSCNACLHMREMAAEALARVIGWDTPVLEALPRFRCSACGVRRVHVSIFYRRRPRGWNSHP